MLTFYLKKLLCGAASCALLLGGTAAAQSTDASQSQPPALAPTGTDRLTPSAEVGADALTPDLAGGADTLDTVALARRATTRSVPQAATVTARSRLVERTAGEPPAAKPERHLSRIMHRLPVTSQDGGPTLLFSDSPEYATESGILYRDTVDGAVRVLYYHVNQTQHAAQVAVVLENVGVGTAMVTIQRAGLSQPSPDYLFVGKATQAAYFDAQRSRRFFLKKGEAQVLDPAMTANLLAPDDLVYGVYDFVTTQDVRVSVVFCPAGTDPTTYVRRAPVLPADSLRLRGTFQNADRTLTATRPYDPEKDEINYVLLADNESDPYRTGIDATDGTATLNYGNYGILYHLHFPVQGRTRTQFYLSPFGGTYAGAVRARLKSGRENLLLTPPDTISFGAGSEDFTEAAGIEKARTSGLAYLTDSMELADLGTYTEFSSPDFLFSPPGASNLPAAIILMPAN